MAGFGHSTFGNGSFGISDVGTDLIINSFPVEYLEDAVPDGVNPMDDTQSLLMQMLKTHARMINVARTNTDNMEQLTDYATAPDNILLLLGNNFGLDIDKNDPEFLKRSFVAHASQWLQIKSSVESYSVRGLASGFIVDVTNFWRIDPSYAAFIPPRFLYYFTPSEADPGVASYLHTDTPPGTYPGTPTAENASYAKSAWLRIVFEVKDYSLFPTNFNTLLDLAIDKITDVKGIHHELTPPEFRITLQTTVKPNVSIEIEEQIVNYPFNEFDHYDIIPADTFACDHTAEVALT